MQLGTAPVNDPSGAPLSWRSGPAHPDEVEDVEGQPEEPEQPAPGDRVQLAKRVQSSTEPRDASSEKASAP